MEMGIAASFLSRFRLSSNAHSLLGGGTGFDADDFAFDFFALRGFEFGFVAVDLILHVGADYEVGCVHGFLGVGAAGV